MTLTEAQKAEVRAAMEAYATAYCKRDLSAMKTIFSARVCGFGSGPDEVVRDRNTFVRQMERDLGQATVLGVVFSETLIHGDAPFAWVMTRSAITFAIGNSPAQTLNGRSTMVLRNTGSRWLIEQIHFSMPYAGQDAGQSFPGA